MSEPIRETLEKQPIEASAPCRIDAGGTWDIRSLALPMERLRPTTINIALNLRTRVRLSPYAEGRVRIVSEGFSHDEEQAHHNLPFDSPFGLFFAAVAYFGYDGLQAHISAEAPVKSALGGSSTALVAFIKALTELERRLGGKPRSRGDVLHLGYHLEDAVSQGKCGIQDQAAAVYGGINRWTWQFGRRKIPLQRMPLLKGKDRVGLSRHILVAFSGKSHVSSRINRAWIQGFLSGRTRAGWIRANEIVRDLEQAIAGKDWDRAARALKEEMAVRRQITPDALIPLTAKLIDQAEGAGCGARFAGAGAGGSVWALGEIEKIEHLRQIWKATLAPVRKAQILDCAVDPVGMR